MMKQDFNYNCTTLKLTKSFTVLPIVYYKSLVSVMLKILHSSVLGTEITGEVMEVGQSVRKFKPGDKVVAIVNPFVSCH